MPCGEAQGTSNNRVIMPYYDKQFLEKLNDLSIESVAVKLGMEVKKHRALCPWHSDHNPSLRFNTSSKKNFCHCFVCGNGGNPITLTMQVENCGFQEACQILAKEFSIPLPNNEKPKFVKKIQPKKSVAKVVEPENFSDVEINEWVIRRARLSDKAKQFLFEERKYNEDVVSQLGIGSVTYPDKLVNSLVNHFGEERCIKSGLVKRGQYGLYLHFYTPCLLFPYKDMEGRIINLQSRYLGKKKDVPRFQFIQNAQVSMFNVRVLKDMELGEKLFLSEGITDCIALLSSGRKAIAIPSATLLKEEQLNLLAAKNLYIYPDQDEAGERMFKELQEMLGKRGAMVVRVSLPKGCKDFSDYYIMTKQ